MAIGSGTLIMGISFILSATIQAFINTEAGAFIIVFGILTGSSLVLYAQIKYNKGIF